MAATAIDDAKRFLDLHPWSTTDVDNPVELLRAVVDDFDKDLDEKASELEKDHEANVMEAVEERLPEEIDKREGSAVTALPKLLAFIQGLRDDMKICEAEYQTALALVK